jgi:hypothetical protein
MIGTEWNVYIAIALQGHEWGLVEVMGWDQRCMIILSRTGF